MYRKNSKLVVRNIQNRTKYGRITTQELHKESKQFRFTVALKE